MNAYRDQYAQVFKNGRNIVLIAISADPDTALASWARDAEYPFLFASDSNSAVGKAYGAFNAQYKLDNRTLFVVGPDGKIAYRAMPFREIDPTAYTELATAITRTSARSPYFLCAASIRGNSSAQMGHHVAQNSIMTGFFPIHWDNETESPFRFCSVTGGGVSPTGIPIIS